MAAVALANGLNANMLRKWVAEAESGSQGAAPVDVKPLASPCAGIRAAGAGRSTGAAGGR
jgi:transposase-like protein